MCIRDRDHRQQVAERQPHDDAEPPPVVRGRGLWVSPDDDVVTLQSVGPLPRTLAGHAAYPDWSLVPPPDGSVPVSTPTRVTVKVDDRVVHEQAIAPVPGWHALGPMETGVSDAAPWRSDQNATPTSRWPPTKVSLASSTSTSSNSSPSPSNTMLTRR